MEDPQAVNPVTPVVSETPSGSPTLESRPVVDMSAPTPNLGPTPPKKKKVWLIAIVAAAALLIIAAVIFFLFNFTGGGGVVTIDQDERTFDPRQPFSRQMSPEQVSFSTEQTLDLFFRNRNSSNLYPSVLNCNISTTVCTSDLPNHRTGYAMLWANYRALLQNPNNQAASNRLSSDLSAYADLIASHSFVFQNNTYNCSLMREISSLPSLTSEQTTVLHNLCFTSKYENTVSDPGILPVYTTEEAVAVISQKLANLDLQPNASDAATALLLAQPSQFPSSRLSAYSAFVTDQVDRVLWENELGGKDNINIDQAYVAALRDAAVFNPNVDYTQSALNDYNVLLSAYFLYSDQVTIDQQLNLALANQKVIELLRSLNIDSSPIAAFQNQLLAQINLVAPPASMTQLADSVYPLMKVEGLNTNMLTTFSNRIIDNFYYFDDQLAGFSNSLSVNDVTGVATHSFLTLINGMFSGMLVK